MPRPAISVVIVSYNTRDLLRECLKSVYGNIDVSRDEIWVIDNNSMDGSVEMVQSEFPEVHVEAGNVNRGFAYGCNRGLKNSKSEYVFFVNSDVLLAGGTVNRMLEKMEEDHRIGILSPELVTEQGDLAQMSWGWNLTLLGEMRQKFYSPRHIGKHPFIKRLVRWLQRSERDVPIVAGACMMARKEMLNKISGMDEDYELYFEDADLCVRTWKAGYSVRFTPRIKVHHGLGQSGRSQPKKILLVYRQSQITFYRKHNNLLELFFLKIYLWMKFTTGSLYWRDPLFRYWISQILREKKRFLLSMPLKDS